MLSGVFFHPLQSRGFAILNTCHKCWCMLEAHSRIKCFRKDQQLETEFITLLVAFGTGGNALCAKLVYSTKHSRNSEKYILTPLHQQPAHQIGAQAICKYGDGGYTPPYPPSSHLLTPTHSSPEVQTCGGKEAYAKIANTKGRECSEEFGLRRQVLVSVWGAMRVKVRDGGQGICRRTKVISLSHTDNNQNCVQAGGEMLLLRQQPVCTKLKGMGAEQATLDERKPF